MRSYQNDLAITIHQSAGEAPNYATGERGGEGFGPARITGAHVVRKGMESGRDTVDLHFETPDGRKHICMLTGALVKMLASTLNLQDG